MGYSSSVLVRVLCRYLADSIATDRQTKAVLSHPDAKLRGQTADGRRCVIVSAKNSEESELLVVPLAW